MRIANTGASRHSGRPIASRPLLFLVFFVSGCCGLLYQVVWTRMAFASFGIITPVLSVVLSVFMSGLSLGAWAGGRWTDRLTRKTRVSALLFYALAELLIGLGAFAVPALFTVGERLLFTMGQADSLKYLVSSAVVLAVSILPWCVCMGATFPLMMGYIREAEPQNRRSFSFLYLANVLGAMSGTLLTAFVLIETLGFHHTLWVAAGGNFAITAVALWLALAAPGFGARPFSGALAGDALSEGSGLASASETLPCHQDPAPAGREVDRSLIQWILFSTGFCSMAMEVVWFRAFGPVLKTQVYAFALIVAAYLGATSVGSLLYRFHLRKMFRWPTARLLALLCVAALLPIVINDARLVKANWNIEADPASVALLLFSLCPFCALLGYLTPALIDEYGAGSPSSAGKVYALNVVGCILGPLLASYILLPFMSERLALILLGLPFLLFYLRSRQNLPAGERWGLGLAAAAALAWAVFLSKSYEDWTREFEKNTVVRRDYAASVISFGENREKHLVVNGVGMTTLTPITKFMVHLPLALHAGNPKSALIICFGMGTSYRSALSWGIETTTVELVPSVLQAFDFYHADAPQFIADPHGRMIVDDGRRFLKRTLGKYDLIVVDPPPPPQAAGSSLLYSREFYELAREHLNPGGILQAWVPRSDLLTAKAAFRSIHESFPCVRRFRSIEGWGSHLLASREPIPRSTAEQLAARLPARAKADLLEWSSGDDVAAYLDRVLSHETPIETLLSPDRRIRITDDHPFNEYFLLRHLGLF